MKILQKITDTRLEQGTALGVWFPFSVGSVKMIGSDFSFSVRSFFRPSRFTTLLKHPVCNNQSKNQRSWKKESTILCSSRERERGRHRLKLPDHCNNIVKHQKYAQGGT